MNSEHWETIYSSNGPLHAEILRSLLEAQDIPVFLSQEGAGSALGLTIGPLGEIQVMVPSSRVFLARQILADYLSELDLSEQTPEEGDDLDE